MPSMLSIFYASAIAINTQIVFVHKRTVKDKRQILFLVVPPLVALLIGMYPPSTLRNIHPYLTHQIPSYTHVDRRRIRL
jgi:hypothetical protein